MIDPSSIVTLVTSLQAASEITKVMVGLRDGAMLQAKAIELNGVILTAQSSALASNVAQAALLDRVGNLEKQIAQMEAWDAEKQRYELAPLYDGSLACRVKEAMRGAEPEHYICANCYTQGKKSILQGATTSYQGHVLTCPQCKAEIVKEFNYKD